MVPYTKDLINSNDALPIDCTDIGSVGLQLTGTWTGTVTFEGTVNGSTWSAIAVTAIATGVTGVVVTTTTANGVFQAITKGLAAIRARFSTASSGTVTVSGRTSFI